MVDGEYRIYCTLRKDYINKIIDLIEGRDPLHKKPGRKGKSDIENDILNIYDENFEESIVLNFERFINEYYTK